MPIENLVKALAGGVATRGSCHCGTHKTNNTQSNCC